MEGAPEQEQAEQQAATLVLVRATINLPKLRAGQVAFADPSDPYIAARLEAGHIILVEQ